MKGVELEGGNGVEQEEDEVILGQGLLGRGVVGTSLLSVPRAIVLAWRVHERLLAGPTRESNEENDKDIVSNENEHEQRQRNDREYQDTLLGEGFTSFRVYRGHSCTDGLLDASPGG